jgi:hypothetical protein
MDVIERGVWLLDFLAAHGAERKLAGPRISTLQETRCSGLLRNTSWRGISIDDGTVVERNSAVMHEKVVAPALTLLRDRARFKDAETQFRDAPNKLANHKWANAISEASAAVEIVLLEVAGLQRGQLPA